MILLTNRDKLIIDTLKQQDFCFYKDIQKRFFSSDFSASHRLNYLKKKGYILIEPFSTFSFKNSLDSSALEILGKNLKVISLSDKGGFLRRKLSPWKKTHQLLIFSVKERLENLLGIEAAFESQIRNLKHTLYDRTFEPLPDFYFIGEDFKLAIELELHTKSQSRYSLKMSEYKKSSFTHVLYIVTHARKISVLIKNFQYKKYVGIAHYAKAEEVISYRYGELSLFEWLTKRTK